MPADPLRLDASGAVVLVEDGETDVAAFRRVFREFGAVTCFASGELALDGFRAGGPAIDDVAMLVVDMRLPGIDGAQLIRAVRELDGGAHPVILGLSVSGDPKVVDAALAAGADDYFFKPSSLSGLRDVVTQLVLLTNETLGERP